MNPTDNTDFIEARAAIARIEPWADLASTAVVDGRDTRRFIVLPPYRLNVRIGEVSGRPAGQYRDVITVDVVILE